jgi:prepilin-type N-terminal cleavage/methylation domain-containing protein
MRRSAFSLIELLVVVGVMGLLMAMGLAVYGQVQRSADALITSQRIEGVLQGLQASAKDGLSAGQIIHRTAIAPALVAVGKPPGVLRLTMSAKGSMYVSEGAWLNPADPAVLRFPWGKPGVEPDGTPVPPLTRTLADFSPVATLELLAAAATGATVTGWQSDRAPELPFNDAWGNPLIVAFGIYQPTSEDLLRLAEPRFQSTLALYLAVGSSGPNQSAALTGVYATDRDALWGQIATVCKASEWSETGYGEPPWSGVRRGISGKLRSFLSAPLELK